MSDVLAGIPHASKSSWRVIIVAGPSRGKSTLAHKLHTELGYPVWCGDPASKVLYQKPYTTYLPERLPFAGDAGAAAFVAREWFSKPGPAVWEGHVMARALRRWLDTGPARFPCERIIVLDCPAHRPCSKAQEAMHKSVMKVWDEIEHHFAPITRYRTSVV